VNFARLPDLLKTRERDKEGGERDRASIYNPTCALNLRGALLPTGTAP
jgi:hypothetical protein